MTKPCGAATNPSRRRDPFLAENATLWQPHDRFCSLFAMRIDRRRLLTTRTAA
jgi:hypothetical protein